MRAVRWYFWAILGGCAAVWVILGFTLPQDNVPANDLFNGMALAAFGAALLFVVIYTVKGLLGPVKWWSTNIGSIMVLAAVSVMLIVGPVAFAVLFHHGQINTWWLAWLWIGGHLLAAVAWTMKCGLLLRAGGLAGKPAGPPGAGGPAAGLTRFQRGCLVHRVASRSVCTVSALRHSCSCRASVMSG